MDGLDEFASLARLDNPYDPRYATKPEKEIRDKPTFTGERLNLSLLCLAGSTNAEGFDHALTEVFGDDEPPHRSSLSKARALVSWTFRRSTETRRRYSRSYPRQIKSSQSSYQRNSVVESRARPPPRR